MRACVLALGAVTATACTRRVPVSTMQSPIHVSGEAAVVSSTATTANADAGATSACSAITRFERECLRNDFGELHTGYVVTEPAPFAVHPFRENQLHRLEVGIEALIDAGVVASYAQTIDPGGDARMTRIAEEAAADGMARYLNWCFAREDSVTLARSKVAIESSPGGPDAGARVVETVPIAWLRDGVIPQTPLCREEADWARIRAAALKDGVADAGTLTILRVTNGGCGGLTLQRSTGPEKLVDGGTAPRDLAVGMTLELLPAPGQAELVFGSGADRVLVRWSGTRATVETRALVPGKFSETADVDCAGTVCNVTLRCAGPLSRWPAIGARFQLPTDDQFLDGSAAGAVP